MSAGRAGAVGTRGTSGSGLAAADAVGALPAGLPRGPLTAPGVPALRTVFGLACHVTDSHRRPEVACVTGTEIPRRRKRHLAGGPGPWRSQGFTGRFREMGLTASLLGFWGRLPEATGVIILC